MSIWNEIRDDYIDEEENCFCIDAWLTDDENEEGSVIAKVYIDIPKVEYLDERARTDTYAQEVIEQLQREISSGFYLYNPRLVYRKENIMNKTKYKLRHISCNMTDFHADRHRFRFEYNKKEHIAECYGALDVYFDEETEREIPEDVLCEIQHIIWNKIDKEEKKWRYPKEAYGIASDYVAENFV